MENGSTASQGAPIPAAASGSNSKEAAGELPSRDQPKKGNVDPRKRFMGGMSKSSGPQGLGENRGAVATMPLADASRIPATKKEVDGKAKPARPADLGGTQVQPLAGGGL